MHIDRGRRNKPILLRAGLLLAALLASAFRPAADVRGDATPPSEPVKLIFIHHSTGENWLRDDYGGLGLALANNKYFVSDTNYGWGPNAIGDRTDIPDWLEWFASEQTPATMQAVYNENDQHAEYSRLFPDPGGENTIVLFKSCFPNSALEGDPDDPPDPEGWLTVGHAKYVYNQILTYFASRPDKLFIVITAPPLSDRTHAANARAFNDWLVNDWLAENGYTAPNVAVFDFYNVLTARDAHHRVSGGTIEHTITDRNTLYYPSGDDHPSEAGSRKATEEFLPLLNYYYHRWASDQSGTPPAPAPALELPQQEETAVDTTSRGSVGQLFTGFDSDSTGIEVFSDPATDTSISWRLTAEAYITSPASLQIDFDVSAGSWATCILRTDAQPDWGQGRGLFYLARASSPGIPYEVLLLSGDPESPATYVFHATTPDSSNGWIGTGIPWEEFHRVDWEENGGTVFSAPDEILALGFGFNGTETSRTSGRLGLDDIRTLVDPAPPTSDPNLCALLVLLPLSLTVWMVLLRRK